VEPYGAGVATQRARQHGDDDDHQHRIHDAAAREQGHGKRKDSRDGNHRRRSWGLAEPHDV
jgi:hypothetical protein